MQKIPYTTDQNDPTIQAYSEAVEKGKKDQHVLPRGQGWVVKNLLSDQIIKMFDTQQDAIAYAEKHASNGTSVFVHAQNGLITGRIDY